MDQRTIFMTQFRGDTIGTVDENSSSEESFQNQTIRPILKLQNDLLIATFANFISKYKSDFQSLTIEKKMAVIDNSIQKDIKFRNALKGIIIGLFTLEEYGLYIKNSSNLNKRMMNLVIERLKSQVQLFENNL